MAATYTPIATTTLGSSATIISFSSIPSTYTDLVIIWQTKANSGAYDLGFTINGDTTGTNYSWTNLVGNGSTAGSSRGSNVSYARITNTAYAVTTEWTIAKINIQNYSNATTYKSYLSRVDRAGAGTEANVGLWRNTSTITSVTLQLETQTGTQAAGSIATLYGIKAA